MNNSKSMSTILEVAAKAGVSHATVTRFFRKPNLLAPATFDRVKEAVAELNYVPNAAARSLFTGRTDIVSLIVPDITSSFFTKMADGAEDAAHEKAFTLTLGKTAKNIVRERAYLEALVSHRVDGVILTPGTNSLEHIELLKAHKIPLVLVDRQIEGSDVDVVCGNSFEAGRLLTAHLLEQGCKDVAFVGGEVDAWSLEERLAGYKQVMKEAGLTPRVYLESYSAESGEKIIKDLLSKNMLPDAIFAASSRVVLGVFKALREAGIQVPGDIAVVCVDDVKPASMIDPFLTVVEQPAYEIGQLAMKCLVKRIQGSRVPPAMHILPVELIVRRSSLWKS